MNISYFFIHSPADEHVCCLHFQTTMNNGAINIHVQVLVCTFIWEYICRSAIAGIIKCLTMFSKVDAPFSSPPAVHKSSNFSTFSPTFPPWIFKLFTHSLSRHLNKSCHIQDAGATVRSKTNSACPGEACNLTQHRDGEQTQV